MARFQKGQSGNPSGRPPKDRALTAILERALSHTILDNADGGVQKSRKRILARLVSEGATEGRVMFPDGSTIQLGPQDWMNFVKWIYSHVDGPPRAELDVTSKGESLFDMPAWIARAEQNRREMEDVTDNEPEG